MLDENNGIIKRTQVAVNAYDDGRVREEGMLQAISNTFEDYLGKIGQGDNSGSVGNGESSTPASPVVPSGLQLH